VADLFTWENNTAAWTPPGGAMYINGKSLAPLAGDASFNQALYIFELLHQMYGFSDGNIMKALNTKSTFNSVKWIQDNCVNGAGNE
jgi:hypothetical protein